MKKIIFISLAILLTVGLIFNDYTGVVAKAASKVKPQSGGILRIAISASPRSIGWTGPSRRGEQYISFQCIEGLLKYDEEGNPSPHLVTSWDIDAAASTLTLHIKKGVKFHDGTEFNAEVVKWQLTRIPVGQVNALKAFVNSIDVIDNYTVRLNCNPHPKLKLGKLKIDGVVWSYILEAMCLNTGLMISPTAYKTKGADWIENNPVGTGPFKFVSYERDVKIKYERFDDYWGGKPYLDGIEYYIIVDPVTQKAAFLSGDVDVICDIAPRDAKELEAKGYKITVVPGQDHTISGDGSHDYSVWSNLKVRQAMMYAIDTGTIAKTIGQGYWKPTARDQMGIPGGWADNPDVKGYLYDPEKAKQLLAEAGYPNGFKTTLLARTAPRYWVDYITAIQGQLKAVGIDATLDLMDPGREFHVQVKTGWKNGILQVPNTFKNVLMQYWLIYRPENTFHQNVLRPDEVSKVLFKAMTSPDFKTRQETMWKLQKLVVDEYALSQHLFLVTYIAVKNPKVHDDALMDISAYWWHPQKAWISK